MLGIIVVALMVGGWMLIIEVLERREIKPVNVGIAEPFPHVVEMIPPTKEGQ